MASADPAVSQEVTSENHDKVHGVASAIPELSKFEIAVCIPCHNEEKTIARVIADFRQQLPYASIYVYDNASTDFTSQSAATAGAIVRREPLKGKGHVVRRMFSDVEADIYLLVDGDATYDASSAPKMLNRLLAEYADMVTAVRIDVGKGTRRRGHHLGNRGLTWIVKRLFGSHLTDLLSGYRVLSRRFVKSFPALSIGFEIETELTAHALELRMPICELPTNYFPRSEGSVSKLKTFVDGVHVLATIFELITRERPFWFFSILAAIILMLAVTLGGPVLIEYLNTGLVERFPTAILSMILMVVSLLCLTCGIIVRMITVARREARRFAYLREPYLGKVKASISNENRLS